MKLIGKGTFSKVYQDEDKSKVIIFSNDHAKECLSMGWLDNETGIFPECESLDNKGDYQCYTMKFYPKTRGLKPHLKADQWALYQELRTIFQGLAYPRNMHDNYSYLYEVFENSSLDDGVKYDILDMIDNLANWGTDICFEISPRNVAVDNGKLILLDCFFFKSQLLRVLQK